MILGFIAKERTVKKSYMETMKYGLGFFDPQDAESYNFMVVSIT